MVGHSAVMRYTADGFREDADTFLLEFVERHSVEFSVFAEIWKNSEFSAVFMGRQCEKELQEFIKECFMITLGYFTPVESIRLKVGAVYLLFGLYVKQPMESKCKIRIQRHHWEEIVSLYEYGLRENHLSIPVIIDKLISMSAFHYVLLPRLMGPIVTLSSEPSYAASNQIDKLKSVLREYIEGSNMQFLSALHEKYENEKKKIGTKSNDLNTLLENKYDEIQGEFEALVFGKDEEVEASTCEVLDENVETDLSHIGNRRSHLKQKQYEMSYTDQVTKRRKALLEQYAISDGGSGCNSNDSNVDDPDDPPAEEVPEPPPPPKKKFRRRRRKPRSERKRGRPKKLIEFEEESEKDEPLPAKPSSLYGDDDLELPSFEFRKIDGFRKSKPRKTKYHYASDSDEDPFLLC